MRKSLAPGYSRLLACHLPPVTFLDMRFLDLSLSSRFKAIAFLAPVALVCCLLAGEALRIGAAAILARSRDSSGLERAVRINPGNPDTHVRLGLYDLNSGDAGYAKAIHQFRMATALNPLDTTAWSELAEACDLAGDRVCADESFARVVRLSPIAPRAYWQTALHFVTSGRPGEALPYFRRLLELDPHYDTAVFRLCPDSLRDPNFVLSSVFPSRAGAALKLDYVNYLTALGKHDLAYSVWNHALTHDSAFPASSAAPLIESLLSAGHVQEAASVWDNLEGLGTIAKPSDPHSLVFNGGFEHAPLNFGFDWRIQSSPDLFISPQSPNAYRGRQCLRIDFAVATNAGLEPVYQLVAVEPGQSYRLTAFVRSDSIASESGPRLRVLDPQDPNGLNVSTEPITGTIPWRQVSLVFSAGINTHLVRVSVWRPRSRFFPFNITGTFWVDGVSIKTVANASAIGSPHRGRPERPVMPDTPTEGEKTESSR